MSAECSPMSVYQDAILDTCYTLTGLMKHRLTQSSQTSDWRVLALTLPGESPITISWVASTDTVCLGPKYQHKHAKEGLLLLPAYVASRFWLWSSICPSFSVLGNLLRPHATTVHPQKLTLSLHRMMLFKYNPRQWITNHLTKILGIQKRKKKTEKKS